ncbi:transporter substrate-binding domain-containing protein [Desulfoferrobacter suflitae]|uniref:transporter substrate-binding domain-containing protein n=1 Tax=Desulfoferrobacter suflitae TaxID=2865782 RepID=UPI0021647157|nr:transporter substrate-binding domain-containing protein [Desulfoferrobacter suflitae]MCK8601798.1 transporter substrate-binding domain-containing protein [Desulfoferrobacter suflitae]
MCADRWFRSFIRPLAVIFPLSLIVMTLVWVCRATAAQGAAAAAPPIVSAAEIAYPPFSFADAKGRATGFSVELLRAALAAMGRDVTLRMGSWAEVRGWLERGEVQALPLVGRRPEREPIFDFTFPYMSLHGAVVVREGTTDIGNLEDLEGRRVAVMKGDNAEEFLRREDRGIEIHTTVTFHEALRELSQGLCDAVVIQRLVALRLIQENKFTNLKIVSKPIEGFRQDFCFAVKEGDRDTLALLNEGLALVMADGTYQHLHAKWFAALELPTQRRIVIGGDHHYPPYEYLDDNGRPTGFTVELTRAIANELGLDIEMRLGPWAQILQGLEQGEIDVIQGMFYSPERDLRFDFTPPYLANHYVSVVRRDDGAPPADIAQLKGKRIVVQHGDVIYDLLVEKGLADQVTFVETQEEVLKELAQGKHDCGLAVRVSALYFMEKHGWTNLVLGSQPLLSAKYCYAVLNGHTALLASFSEGLEILRQTGDYLRIKEKWLGIYQDEPPSLITAMRYSLMVLAPLLLALLAFFLWSWSLRKQVTRRTAQLQESERQMATLLGNLPGMAYQCRNDSHWTMHFVSDGCRELTGYDAEEMTRDHAVSYNEIIHPDDRRYVWEQVQHALHADAPFTLEYRIVTKGGDRKWVWEKGRVVPPVRGGELMLEGFITDVTERRRNEDALKDEAMRRRILVDESRDGIVVLDQNGKVYEANRRFCEMLGYSAEEVAQLHVWDWDDQWTREHLLQMVRSVGDAGDTLETRHRRKDGTCFEVEISTNGAVIAGEKLIFCVCRDVTERNRSEQRIAHLNRVLWAIRRVNQLIVRGRDVKTLIHEGCRLLVENRGYASAVIILTDDQDHPVEWAGEGLGEALDPFDGMLERGELPSCCRAARSTTKVVAVENRLVVCRLCSIAAQCAQTDSLSVRLVHDGVTFGYLVAALEQGLGADPEEQSLFAEIGEDFSYALNALRMAQVREKSEYERHSLQRQLLQAQKLESVGRLAGGVAHDYNNMLGVIMGYAELLLMMIDRTNPARIHLEEILKAAERSAGITRQLLTFARQQTVAPQVLDLNAVVESMLKMLRRLIGEDIDLVWLPSSGLWRVKIDPVQVDQILANLCVNARDAISGVGGLTIETENVHIDTDYCTVHAGFVPGDYVLLAVSDSGCGMDRETLENIFEPFFTTKEAHQGTGLGLATVYGIVRQNNGCINVYSEPGKGTTFKIYLPRHEGLADIQAAQSVEPVWHGRGEMVLLVEDEAAMMEMTRVMLERLGFRVLTANVPGRAMRMAEEHAGEVELLITDVVMPEMSGRALAEQLQSRYPNLRVLFMSGYTANSIAHHGVLEAGVHFIAKPFSMQDLATKIRTMMEHK